MIAVLPLIVGIQCLLQAFLMEVSNSPGAKETRRYIHELIDTGDIGLAAPGRAEPTYCAMTTARRW